MKYLGIVGTSHLSETEEMDARKIIAFQIQKYITENPFDGIGIITGDAEGIDKLVWEYIKEHVEVRGNSRKYISHIKNWEHFKQRNIAIATASNKVISISTNTKTEKCYHCNEDHERTGGCYTLKEARKVGKAGKVLIV